MSNTIIKNVLLASTIFGGSVMLAAPALAQSAQQPVEAQPDLEETAAPEGAEGEIVVTGSRISRPNLEQSSPVAVISEEEISLVQPVSAEEFLRELPGSVPGTNPATNNGANGSATLNLRGLGTNRNLVLLNERRVVPATLGGVADLNVIPVALLQRVDVFTGGASTAYGADAIAGVVNFITRRNFAGVDISANYGISERGDGANYRTDLTIGANFADDRGNAVIGISHTKTDPVTQGSRDIGLVSRSSICTAAVIAAGTCAQQTVGVEQGSGAAAPATIFFPFTAAVVPGQDTFAIGQTNNFNFNPLNVFQTPFERNSIFGQAHFEVSPAVTVYTEALFAHTEVDQIIAPSATFFNPFQLPLNNQFLTNGQRQQLCQAGADADPTTPGRQAPTAAQCVSIIAAGTEIDAIVARRFVEAGPRRTNFTTDTYQLVAGLRGPLTSTLDWNISGQYGQSSRRNTSSGQGLQERFQQSIRGCPAGSAAGCVPINIFGAAGTLSPEAFAFLNVQTNTFIDTDLTAAQAIVQGDVGITSPFAQEPIGIAVGAEYRRYGGSQRGDLPSSTPGAILGAGGAFTTIQGNYDSKEVFAEVVLPLIERGFIHNLTLEAGARYSDYSTSGGNTTYKVGGSMMPTPDIKFRGVYSRAVRAPNLGELFAPQNTVLSNRAVDPCQLALPTGNATLTALCSAQLTAVGAPTTLLGTIPAPFAGQINVTTGGNPLLDPEVAKTLTGGVVLQPRFLPGFAATVDYYRIRVSGAISAPSQADVIDACFAQTNPQAQQCQLIRRNPLTGGLSGSPATTQGPILALSNLGRIESEGFDFTVGYNRNLGFAKGSLSFNGNHTTKSRFQATPTGIFRECAGFYSISCGAPIPKISWNARGTLSFAETDVSLLWRHLGRTRVEPQTAATAGELAGKVGSFGPANVIGAYRDIDPRDYFDLAIQHNIGEHFRMTFLVQNLLDGDAPDVGNTIAGTAENSGNTFPGVYDAIGRSYRVGVSLRF